MRYNKIVISYILCNAMALLKYVWRLRAFGRVPSAWRDSIPRQVNSVRGFNLHTDRLQEV